MLRTEERLFDEYKRADNICRDMFSSQNGISQYITEMEQKSFCGYSMVPSWDGNYRRLKRTRWLRNQIADEAFVTDCNEGDVAWLEDFHHRLLECRDPLALLEKANRERLSSPSQSEHVLKIGEEQKAAVNNQLYKREDASLKWVVMLLIGIAVVAVLLICSR